MITDGTTGALAVITVGQIRCGDGIIGVTEVSMVMAGTIHGDGIDGTDGIIGDMADSDLVMQVLDSDGIILITAMVMAMEIDTTIAIIDTLTEAMRLTTQDEVITTEPTLIHRQLLYEVGLT
ncbi:MAG: hypothetical protein ABJM12_00930 [Ekhidna sp.]